MFIISKENLDETRIEKRAPGNNSWEFVDIIGAETTPKATPEASDTGATQRVYVTDESISTTAPTPPPRQATSPHNNTNVKQRAMAAAARKKKEKITIITLCSVVAMLLIAVIIVIASTVGSSNDNGLIFKNVFAAGVDLGGMTPEQAKAALHQATDDTYSQLDMTVQVLDSTITLSPKDTGARLDINAVVDAAYNYGRTGSRSDRQQAQKLLQTSAYAVPLEAYLTLDTAFIRDCVRDLGKQYSTTLTQTTYSIDGQRPTDIPAPEDIDLTKVYQTLYIQIGTAEYSFNTDRLYEQIMEAYNQNLFQVTGECSVVAPNTLDCDALYQLYCTAPVDATMDPETYAVTPEVYGYGITLSELKTMVAEAKYGQTLAIPMRFIEPDITSKILSEGLFQDVLAGFQTSISANAGWNANMELACKALNGLIIKAGEEFSFNQAIGEPTAKLGYKTVELYVGKTMTSVVGGGLSQVATTLYNCALIADLDILERQAHTYCPTFVDTGLDAQVYYGSMDLRFKNNTEQPIRIEASMTGSTVQIQLIGTNTKDYTVDIIYEVTKTKNPKSDIITMPADNSGNYRDGQVISEGITGYNVNTYKCTYHKETGRQLSKELIAATSYAKRNEVVIEISDSEPTTPSTDAGTTSDPDATDDI